jgi:hypothetical protein
LVFHQNLLLTMAAVIAYDNYLTNTLLVANHDLRRALIAQGLQDFDDYVTLTEDDISDICTNIRKPGGTIANPDHDPANPVAGVHATIPNPGNPVGHLAEKRLKMLRYYCYHMQRIQRPFAIAAATLPVLTECYELQEQHKLEEDEKVELPGKLTNIEKIRQVLENIDNYLSRVRGASGLPLLYVVRESRALPAVDQGYGVPTFDLEMIERGPHTGAYYQRDNISVWNVIRHVTHEGPGWSWVKEYQRGCDGRSAYQAMKRHYLGDQFVARLRASADNVLDTAFYDGKSRTFTFERYCESLQIAFTDIEGTGETVSESRKLRVFLQGITDTRLTSAKSQVIATPALQTYDAAVNFVAQFLDQRQSLGVGGGGRSIPRNISAFDRSNRGGRGGRAGRGGQRNDGRFGPYQGRGGRWERGGRSSSYHDNRGRGTQLSGAYLSSAEWENLTADQKSQIRQLRTEGHGRRNVHAIRNVKRKADDNTVTTELTNSTGVSTVTGVGATMSQRKNNTSSREV